MPRSPNPPAGDPGTVRWAAPVDRRGRPGRHRTRRGPGRGAVALAALVAAAGVNPARAAGAAAGPARRYLELMNGLRASRGLGPLALDANLSSLAQRHASEMARTHHLAHTGALPTGVTTRWTALAENVGMGSSADVVWQAFLTSPGHLSNLVRRDFTHVGIGVVDTGGVEWTTHRFLAAADPVAPPPAHPTPAPLRPPAPPAPPARPAPPAPEPTVSMPPPPTTPAPPPAVPSSAPPPAPTDATATDLVPLGTAGEAPQVEAAGLDRWLAGVAARATGRSGPSPPPAPPAAPPDPPPIEPPPLPTGDGPLPQGAPRSAPTL